MSLLSRFFPGSIRADVAQDSPSKETPPQVGSTSQSNKGRSLPHVKARKSITSLFGFTAKTTPSKDGMPRPHTTSDCDTAPAVTANTISTCLEAMHYPVYDPTNPDHEPSLLSNDKVSRSSSLKRSLSRSPKKLSLQRPSVSPKKSPCAGKRKSRLQGLANTLRAKASIFHGSQESSEEELRLQEAPVPPTPSSAKTVSSRKSVRFRSGHSTIDQMHSNSSPITIPMKSPPSLSMINISHTPMFDTTVGEEANLGQTARPPETLPLHIPSGPSPDKPSQPRLSLEIDDKPGIVQALPTPMPGTNLPLEDPFNDATVALCPDHTARKMLSGRPGSDEGYFPNEESDAETTKNPTSGIVATTKMSAPSETQYDADAEPSDGSEVLVDQAKRPTVKSHLRHHNHDRNSTQDYQLGTELFRCKTPPDARASTLHAVPRLILKKPTSDDSEEVALSLSAGNEAIMQFADRAEEGLTGIGTSPASDVLKTKDRQECLTPTNLSPKLQLGKSRLEGVENVYRADVREPTKQGKATLDVNDTDQLGQIGSISSASSISPLRLPSTMSSISPPRSPCLLRINLSMDKKYDTERLEHGSPSASMITEEAATGLGETYADRAIIHPSAVRSPANIPLPRSPETGMRSGTVSLDVTERPNNSIWSPFGEPGFVAVAYSMLQKTPEALAQRLRSEGIGRDLWKQLGLPKETAPPQVFEPYNEMEMLDLFAAIADIAKAPSAFPHSSLHVATPMGHGYEQICDLDNFTTFNGQRSPLSVRGQSQGENASRNGAVTVGSASSSPLSVFSSRRSSQGRLATPLPSRQVSSHDVFTNNQPTPDVIPLSRLDSIPRKAGPGSDSEHQSAASEIQLSTSIHSKSSQIRSTSTHTRYADPDVKTTAVPTLAMLTRRESSDESQVTQVTAASSASSSRSASELGPAETEAGPNVKCQHPQVDVSKTLLGARSASVNNK